MTLSNIRYILFFLLLLAFDNLVAQTTVDAGSSITYRFSDDQDHPDAQWVVDNGSITSSTSSFSGGIYRSSATVQWTSAGPGSIKLMENGFSLTEESVIVVEPPPPPVNAGPDRTYCKETGSINLADWGLSLVDGVWSGPAITNNLIDLSKLATGNYTYTYTRLSDNTSDAMVLTLMQTLAGNLTLDVLTSCGSLTGKITLNGQQGSVLYWERMYENATTWVPINTTATSYNYIETEGGQIRAVVQKGSCSVERTSPVSFTQVPLVLGTVDLSNYAQGCNSVTGTLKLNGSNGVVKFWERSYDQGLNWTNVPNETALTLSVNETKDAQLRAGVQKDVCTLQRTNTIEVKLLKPAGGFLSPSQVQFTCGRATGTLTLSNAEGTLTWEQYTTNTGWTPIVGATSPYSFDVSSQTSFRVKAESNGCDPVYSNVFTAYVSSQPGSVSTSNGGTQVCGSSTISLTVSGFVGSVLRWEYSTNNSNWTTIDNSAGYASIQNIPQASTNYYRAVVALGSCASAFTPPVFVSVTPPGLPGQVVLVSETSSGQGDNLVFSANFALINSVGSVQNWWKQPNSEFNPVYVNEQGTTLASQTITETTAFSAQVKNGSCDPLVSGKAIFVVNRKSLGIQQLVQGVELTEYAGYSYQIKTSDGISLRDGFTFTANSAQDFFVLLDKDYTLPPSDQNYVLEETVLKEGVGEDDVYFLGAFERTSSYSYLDGLDRPMQQVQRKASAAQKDMIVPVTYDALGRPDKSYLPYEADATDGLYKVNALTAQTSFYQTPPVKVAASSYPFATKVYEASPLNRVLEQGAPGEDWQPLIGHTVKMGYETNAVGEITIWKVNDADMPVTAGTYDGGTLFVNITTDEHGNQTKQYKDDRGLVILKSVQNGTEWINTCYIYDELNLLRFVIQPEGLARLSGDPDQDFLDMWAFQYKYDYRNRLAEKKVPGSGVVYMIYDKRDRVVLTQDANQRQNNQWTFTKYDVLNRPVISGIYSPNNPATRDEMAANVSSDLFAESLDGTNSFFGYTNTVFPTDNLDVMTVTYYDNYDFLSLFGSAFSPDSQMLDVLSSDTDPSRKGLATGGQTRVIGAGTWLKSVNWYDKRYRVVQTLAENHLGGLDRTNMTYDFAGRVITKTLTHSKPADADIKITDEFTYDHAGRVIEQYHKINDGPKVNLKSQEFNAIGQLVEKNLHQKDDGTYQQSVDYRYNIRGWLTHINNADLTDDGGATNDDANDYFGFQLKYNDPSTLGGPSQLNGNISEALWTTFGNNKQSYAYTYDPLNRLKQAKYFDRIRPLNNDRFNENIAGYDHNGNILGLQRGKSLNFMDDLSYTYSGNRLFKVTDGGSKTNGFTDGDNTDDDYLFDANGNMTADKNKGISTITYNYLNLTESVTKSATDNAQYVYNAAGVKLSQTVNEYGKPSKTTDYVGGFVYENKVLQCILHDEGRVDVAGQSTYQYFLKDHLGNVRTTFTTVQRMESNTATMESEAGDGVFIDYGTTRVPTIKEINSTPLEQTGAVPEVARLNGYYNVNRGPAQSIAVFPGDKIIARVNVKYLDLRRDNSIPGASLLNFFATGVGSFSTSELTPGVFQITDNSGSGLSAIIGNGTESDYAPPQAFLNIYFLDKYNDPTSVKAVFAKVDETAAITPQTINNPHQVLTLEYEVTQTGFVYVNVSHDAVENIDVYFDDLYVEHQKGFIVQQQDYFAFGMEFNAVTQDGLTSQNFLYNGKERLGLTGWLDYGARMYMPEIGRWGVVDPHADRYKNVTPYNYCFNIPTLFTDPTGMDGRITGEGTKDKPFVIEANYYHYNLSEDEEAGLKAAVKSYNDLGVVETTNENGDKVYYQFSLKAEKKADFNEAQAAADDNSFNTTINGKVATFSFGNVVTADATKTRKLDKSKQDAYGSANGSYITAYSSKIKNDKWRNGDMSTFVKSIFSHEIGHNVGGLHGDPGTTMDNIKYDDNGATYPTTTTTFTNTIFNRRNKPPGTDKDKDKDKGGTVGGIYLDINNQ